MNGENAADGVGITAKLADKILAAGADVITLGNHVWRQRDIIPVLERNGPVIRPENLGGPGRGLTVQPAAVCAKRTAKLRLTTKLAPPTSMTKRQSRAEACAEVSSTMFASR